MVTTSGAKIKARVSGASAFILHRYPYRESSLIIDIFSRDYGRLSLVARGARRARSGLQGVLLAFQPLQLDWFGSNELKTLHAAEWLGGVPQLSGLPLLCGFYLNELLIRLLARDDPYPALFVAYQEAIYALANEPEVEPTLRRFELSLLAELGYGLRLDYDALENPIVAQRYYRLETKRGMLPVDKAAEAGIVVTGQTLAALACGDFSNGLAIKQSKPLLRECLAALLGDKPLYSRQLLRDLQKCSLPSPAKLSDIDR